MRVLGTRLWLWVGNYGSYETVGMAPSSVEREGGTPPMTTGCMLSRRVCYNEELLEEMSISISDVRTASSFKVAASTFSTKVSMCLK